MYITAVSKQYKPLVYSNIHDLSEFLKLKTILNKSNKTLSDEEIETLALGLNFIPTTLQNHLNNIQRSKEIEKLTKDINKTIYWLLNPTTRSKGPIDNLIESTWIPPARPWINNTNVKKYIDAYRKQPVKTNTPTTSPTHPKIMRAIKSLEQDPSINITPADKGGCTVIWCTTEYKREALRQLSDTTTYDSITETEAINLLNNLVTRRNSTAKYLLDRNIITLRAFKAIIGSPSSACPIYFLPKIHKEIHPVSLTFPGRPIVATYNSTLYLLDNLLTEITAPLLNMIPGSSKDSTAFLNNLPTHTLPSNATLLTADVNSLYPSIPRKEGIQAATQFYSDNITFLMRYFSENGYTTELPSAKEFCQILTLVIDNSIIHFQNQYFFIQKKGTAMGVCISVYFANTFMFSLTRRYIEKPLPKIIFWTRFIDDIFILTIASLSEISEFFANISTSDISYSLSELDKKTVFLDVSVSINQSNILITEPYFKPTSTPSYLHASSNHPPSTIHSIPYAQLIRLKRLSSSEQIFLKHAKQMIRNFRLRGYNLKILKEKLKAVINIPRQSLLNPKFKINNFSNCLKVIRPFNPHFNWPLSRSILSRLYDAIVNTFESTPIHDDLSRLEVSLIYSTNKNTRSHFSHHIKNGRPIN